MTCLNISNEHRFKQLSSFNKKFGKILLLILIWCIVFQLMSQRPNCAQFFFQLADLGCKLQYPPLRDGARMLLKLIPPDTYTVECLQSLFQNHARGCSNGATVIEQGCQSTSLSPATVESLFFGTSPSQVLYHLEVIKNIYFTLLFFYKYQYDKSRKV